MVFRYTHLKGHEVAATLKAVSNQAAWGAGSLTWSRTPLIADIQNHRWILPIVAMCGRLLFLVVPKPQLWHLDVFSRSRAQHQEQPRNALFQEDLQSLLGQDQN